MATKKITDLVKLTDLDATDSFVVNDSSAGADKRVEFSDLQSEVLNGAAIGTGTAITELQVDNLNLNGNTISSTDTNGNVLIQPNGTGDVIINESGADVDFRVEGDTDQNLLFFDASADSVGIGTSSPNTKLHTTGSLTVDDKIYLQRSSANLYLSIASYWNGSGSPLTGTKGDIVAIGNTGGDGLVFANGDTERMRIDSSGNVGIGTNSPTAGFKLDVAGRLKAYNAGYIADFVSTDSNGSSIQMYAIDSYVSIVQGGTSAVPMNFFVGGSERMRILTGGGITFNGDTAAANALDDYEEGTWTPVFAGSTTNPTVTYATQSGFYTKIGRQVTITFEIGTSANTGGVGAVQVTGLPFTAGSRVYNCVATYNINNTATNAMGIFAEVNASTTRADFIGTGDNTTWVIVNWTDATSASIYINGSFTYFV